MGFPRGDELLVYLVEAMHEGNFTEDITLASGGLLISGTPIQKWQFLELAAERLAQNEVKHPRDESRLWGTLSELRWQALEAAKERIRRRHEYLDSLPSIRPRTREEEEELEDLSVAYINLKDVVIYGATPTPITLPLWRVRVTEISAWTFGRLS